MNLILLELDNWSNVILSYQIHEKSEEILNNESDLDEKEEIIENNNN